MTHSNELAFPVSAELSLETDQLILALLGRDPTDRTEARAKEIELGELFATLTVDEAKALYRRFALPAEDDLVAVRFALLPYEGRKRLMLFIADARQRREQTMVGY